MPHHNNTLSIHYNIKEKKFPVTIQGINFMVITNQVHELELKSAKKLHQSPQSPFSFLHRKTNMNKLLASGLTEYTSSSNSLPHPENSTSNSLLPE